MGRRKKCIHSTESGDYLREKLELYHYLNTVSSRFNMIGGVSKKEKATFSRLPYLDDFYRMRKVKGVPQYRKKVDEYRRKLRKSKK